MSPSLHQVCLLLGSNIEPERNIPRAVTLLQRYVTVLKASSIWESASVDCCYPDYLNLALLVSTSLGANQLKRQVLRPLETQMGRVRTEDKNASRPIDVDIILFEGEVLDPDLWLQAHRAIPVAEIYPHYLSESGLPLKDVAIRLAASTDIKKRVDITVSIAAVN
jgi:2-amino-4-hydroxy-6-hydroxymethyldihydropteridine diphosphokinase